MRVKTNVRVGAFALLPLLAVPGLALAAPGGELFELLPDDGAPGAAFGSAVALHGGLAVVGASNDGQQGLFAGAAYLFDVATGQQLARLDPLDPHITKFFGASVAVHGSTVAVGAPRDYQSFGGALYLFDAATGQQTAKLLPDDAGPAQFFGASVAVDGTRALVGAITDSQVEVNAGAAYLFDLATGTQLLKLVPPDGLPDQRFGLSLALGEDLLVVGSPQDPEAGTLTGSVYVYDATSGALLRKIRPVDVAPLDQFGYAVGLYGTRILAGAPNANRGAERSGTTYVFDALTGEQIGELVPNAAEVSDLSGASIAVDGSRALIGSLRGLALDSSDAGKAWLFDLDSGQQIARLQPGDETPQNRFGFAVALDGGVALVGAYGADDNGPGSGAAYVFDADTALAIPYCFGAQAGACPCGNRGAVGHGCGNSVFPEGARLWASGSPCVADDDLVLRVSSSRPGEAGVFFQGDTALSGGAGAVFGDGLRCAGGAVLRLETVAADAQGEAASTLSLAATAGLSAGDVVRYQWWYRDPGASPCGSGFNLSGGLEAIWGP